MEEDKSKTVMAWHSKSLEQVFQDLNTDDKGLSSEEAERRLEEEGRNKIESGEDVSPVQIFVSQFQDFLIYLLVAAALMSVGVGFLPGQTPQYTEAGLILAILVANGVFGFIQDYKAEKSIEALKDLSTPDATVLRDGEKVTVDSRDIVPGDVVFLDQGDAVPADARIIEQNSLSTDESALTGESTNVSKSAGDLDESTPVAERGNMVFMNTSVVKGRAKALVVETGMETEVGDIADQIESAEDEETPFQKEVDELGKEIGYGIMAIIAVVALAQGAFTSAGPVTIILIAITLAVAAVPEGLPAVVTLTLALGSKKLLKKNALVRRLPVVESLGSVDMIVTDKTGTLTEDTMTVQKLYFQSEEFDVSGSGYSTEGSFTREGYETDPEYLRPLLECGAICNNAEKAPEDEEDEYYGEPTEVALLVSARKAGIKPEASRKREIPFSSDRKRMTVVTEEEEAYMKGAPATVLERCDRIREEGETKELTDEKREKILQKTEEMAQEALRILGFAEKDIEDAEASDSDIESDMVFLGLQGMIDPPRQEVREAVQDCRNAGIRVVMATGDNIETAKAVGEEIGFDPEGAMTGPEIESISDEELREEVKDVEIFARVSPEHKVRILQALQENGHNVAMTGDGVNDAPALKNSDVGISMGKRGTDVAKQSSDMVLQDDNFVSIRDAIAEGRGIFDNIRKFVNYLLSANLGEVLIIFLGVIIGSFMFPGTFQTGEKAALLTPIMLLWINFVTDGLPALALGADPKSEGIMEREPRGQDEPVINKRIMSSIGSVGAIMTATGLGLYFYLLSIGTQIVASTALFTFVVAIEMARIQIIRRRYSQSLLSNKWLLGALISSLGLQALVLYTPLKSWFETQALSLTVLGYVGVAALAFVGLNIVMSLVLDNVVE
jgi:Ca2+-transporting ATPase